MKIYVFPVRSGVAYLGIKSLVNPYDTSQAAWCAGCPSAFGGNDDDDSPLVACSRETGEESHQKLDLDSATFKSLSSHTVAQTSYQFYYATNFSYDAGHVLSLPLAAQPEYQETTGQILLLDLNSAPVNNAGATAAWMLAQQQAQFGPSTPSATALGQFNTSVTVQAFIALAQLHQAGMLDS